MAKSETMIMLSSDVVKKTLRVVRDQALDNYNYCIKDKVDYRGGLPKEHWAGRVTAISSAINGINQIIEIELIKKESHV